MDKIDDMSSYSCCGKFCKTMLPINLYSEKIVDLYRGWIFCSEACAANPDVNFKYENFPTRECIYTKEIQIMLELAK